MQKRVQFPIYIGPSVRAVFARADSAVIGGLISRIGSGRLRITIAANYLPAFASGGRPNAPAGLLA